MEARHSFADRRVVELAFLLPETAWAQGDYDKWLLHEATRTLLPQGVTTRIEKTQFGAVYGHRLKQQREYIDHALSHSYLQDLGLVDTTKLRAALWSDHAQRGELHMAELFCVLTIQVWLSLHVPDA